MPKLTGESCIVRWLLPSCIQRKHGVFRISKACRHFNGSNSRDERKTAFPDDDTGDGVAESGPVKLHNRSQVLVRTRKAYRLATSHWHSEHNGDGDVTFPSRPRRCGRHLIMACHAREKWKSLKMQGAVAMFLPQFRPPSCPPPPNPSLSLSLSPSPPPPTPGARDLSLFLYLSLIL